MTAIFTRWDAMQQPLESLAREIAVLLSRFQTKIVFAESCTGGLISATLARIPGISNFLCGSAVVYRLDTKSRWLGVPESMLINPGPVSEAVARAMADGALAHTPEADVAASITGHLGPDAPIDQDGLIFVGIAVRGELCRIVEHRLPRFNTRVDQNLYPGETEREQRQWAATEFVFAQVAAAIREPRSAH